MIVQHQGIRNSKLDVDYFPQPDINQFGSLDTNVFVMGQLWILAMGS